MTKSLPSMTPQVPECTQWRQGELVELLVTDMSKDGDGVGRWQNRVVFVPDSVCGDRVLVRLVHVKHEYAYGQLCQIMLPSPHRIRPPCFVADKCGGCQWQHIQYSHQLVIKQNQIREALTRIGGLNNPPVEPVLAAPHPLSYRNKVTYPVTDSSEVPHVRIGYYQKGSHHVINLNQCPIQDERLNPLLAGVKQDIQQRGWSIYQESEHRGTIRHLCLRIGRRTGEMLLALIIHDYELPQIQEQAQQWLNQYPNLVGVCLNYNPQRTNRILGHATHCVAGRSYLKEFLGGCLFHVSIDHFFQVYTEQAEALVNLVIDDLTLTGREILLDAYCGIGTLSLPLAKRVRKLIGLEVQESSIQQAKENARLNGIENLQFFTGKVEEQLLSCLGQQGEPCPDIVLLDPPRKGCDQKVTECLLHHRPNRIVYISCQPTTLARDLKQLCGGGLYRLNRVQPIDFFPQTHHVESVAFLSRNY